MNATIYSAQGKSSKTKALETLFAEFRIKHERHQINELRKRHPLLQERLPETYAKQIPHVGFAACYTTFRGTHRFQSYNGLVTLHLNSLSGYEEASILAKEAQRLPQTYATFVGCSGQSLKILVAFTLPNGSLPHTEELATLFHAHASVQAAQYYTMQLRHKLTFRSDQLNATTRFTFDPQASLPIILEQPIAMPTEGTWDERSRREESPLRRPQPNLKREERLSTLFNAAMRAALQIPGESEDQIYRHNFLACLGTKCNQAGIPQEDAIQLLLEYSSFQDREQEVRQAMGNAYQLDKRFGSKPSLPAWQQLTLDLEEFMDRRYELRYNTIRLQNEFRQRRSFHHHFRPLDERTLNSISIQAQKEGIQVWDRDVKRYVNSNQVPLFDPIEHYLHNLPEWDGTNYIQQLADTLPCTNPEVWREQFQRWILGMVAGWQSNWKPQANSTLPLLVGKQGCGKSTWCRSILPRELQAYYTDSIDFAKQQEANLSLTRFALINIDEFDAVSSSYHGFLKHVIQKPVINSRKAYQSNTVAMRRYASFIATCNNYDLLTDPTGSRRFICIEITGTINRTHTINHAQLYAQAKRLLAQGERSWFNAEEEEKAAINNRQFESLPLEEQLFHAYFRRAEEEKTGEWMTALELILELQKMSGLKIGNRNISHFGRILRKIGVIDYRKTSGRYYLVSRR